MKTRWNDVKCTRELNDVMMVHQRTGRGGWGGWGGLQPPPAGRKNSVIRTKLMYPSGKDTVKNILLFNILIYLHGFVF